MMAKQPDRWERMVAKYADRGMPDYDKHVLADHEVIKMLRKEHQEVLRIVEIEPELPGDMPMDMWDAIKSSRQVAGEALRIVVRKTKANILSKLTERAK